MRCSLIVENMNPPPAGEPAETDFSAVGCAITTISSNLTEMSKGVRLLAALMDDEVGSGHKLMGAARTLAGAVSDLLRSVEPAAAEVRRTPSQCTRSQPAAEAVSTLSLLLLLKPFFFIYIYIYIYPLF